MQDGIKTVYSFMVSGETYSQNKASFLVALVGLQHVRVVDELVFIELLDRKMPETS